MGCQEGERVGSLVYEMMAPQVHVVGDGIVGQAAMTGNHQWIIWDAHGSLPKGLIEMNHQILAGIQTIVVIPVLPHGVVQLGSSQMVMENIEFINHVKSLFEQLVRVPRALESDVVQNPLSHNIHQNASLGVSASFSHSGDSPYPSKFSSLDGYKEPSQLLKAHDSRFVSQYGSSFTSLHGKSKLPDNSSEVSSTTAKRKNVPLGEFSSPAIHQVVEHISHHGSDSVGAQVGFTNPDLKFCDSSSTRQYQSQIPSVLSSSGLTPFEEQLLSIPSSQGSADKHMPNSKTSELSFRECILSSSPMDSDTVLPPNNVNDLGHCSSFLSSTIGSSKSHFPISPSEAPQTLGPLDHSNSSRMLSRNSKPGCSTFIQMSQNVPTEGKRISDDNLFRTLELKASQLEEHHPCYGSLLGIPEGDWLSSSNPVQESKTRVNSVSVETHSSVPSSHTIKGIDISESLQLISKKASPTSGCDLFDLLGFSNKSTGLHSNFSDAFIHDSDVNAHEISKDASTCMTQLDTGHVFDASNEEIYCNRMFTESHPEELLDAVVSQMKAAAKDDNISCKTSVTDISNSMHTSSATCAREGSEKIQPKCVDLSPLTVKPEAACSSTVISMCNMDTSKSARYSKKDTGFNSQISLWVQNGQDTSDDTILASHGKQIDESGKSNKKRSRPGENPRPRPKDRQMIQDRVKELREIVPNGAKCSIDALLEKTIKHMLFLQSVTKHADKLKEVGEPKIVSKEGGLLLKDNFEGGATWAFEVGTQSMICPIIVEDLNSPRQMLVEMLCEEQGLFLEIADLIRGLGLTILKGVMEARNSKVWARFAVEANRDVARMEIFLSLVRLLEPNTGSSMVPQGIEPHNMFHTSSSIPATGVSDRLR